MIVLSNLWCWLRGKPPKWTHFEWGLPFFASMEPAGGEPPPDAAPSIPSSGMAVAKLVDENARCVTAMPMSPDEAHGIVVDGRNYTREHFPEGHPDKYVGHVRADVFDQAVDVLAEDWGKLLTENERMRMALEEIALPCAAEAVGRPVPYVVARAREALGGDQ